MLPNILTIPLTHSQLSPALLLVHAVGLLEAGVLLGQDLHLHDHLVMKLNHRLVKSEN